MKILSNGFRKSLQNPPPRKLNHVTRKLEDATRRFLNYLAYCKSARSGNFFECKDWMNEMSDQMCALCASYNTIFDNRKAKGGVK